jgi:predicted transcriptional regulator
MRKVDEIQWAAPAEPVLGILNRMRERDINQMPVLEEGRIVGIVARDAILRVLQTRIQVGDQLAPDRTRS